MDLYLDEMTVRYGLDGKEVDHWLDLHKKAAISRCSDTSERLLGEANEILRRAHSQLTRKK
jgi:hypothetical protein